MKFDIPFIKPSFPSEKVVGEDYSKIIESNWFTNFGPFEQSFRQKVEKYIGNNTHAVTVSNATMGLDIAISALFINDLGKKKVLMPSFTFAAGAEMLIAHGLEPVFIDIDSDTLQPSFSQAKEYLAENPHESAGILLCNIFGVGNPDILLWEELARKHELPIIIDSAAGFGSEYLNGEKIGSRGDCEIFSLHATKPFAVGEGGLIITKNEELASRMRELTNFGFNSKKEIGNIGTNAKMQEFNAALGIRQLEDFDLRLVHRRESLAEYKKRLEPYGLTFQVNDHVSTIPFASVILPNGISSEHILGKLHSGSVEARKYYKPLHRESEITRKSDNVHDLTTTNVVYGSILSLPVHDNMGIEVIDKISSIIIGELK
ncbi:MAG TPA: DegT/DnrJ/EryC1/StrS family aminotransferase [Candidatus Microsaccharimonas sp.]